ncbi:hypothetical protein [Allorhizocola rhizosphaerae]|uniref:hypothetical protein n=1 Tax=Allorhizocola rhizosphaerae TaxID=1872709 RepID=UPI000E3DEB96|nr:hypothetical protein [Allorhizocola rhizosphaerae]
MRTVNVTTPEGRGWAVRVVWQPRWRALARQFGGWRRKRRSSGWGDGVGDFVPAFGDDILAVIAVIVGMVLFGVLFWFVLLPLVLLIVDVLVVVLLMLLAIPARVLLRRPWTVEAASADPDGDTESWFAADVVGWRRALDTRDDIAQKLASGHPAPVVGTLATREA